jgi:hypothetical protein
MGLGVDTSSFDLLVSSIIMEMAEDSERPGITLKFLD